MKTQRKNRNNWYLIAFGALLFLSGTLDAQPVRFSLYISPMLSYAELDFEADRSSQLRVSTGFNAEYYFREHYAISSGIQISHLSAKIEHNNHEIKLRGKYLEVPVSLKMSTDEIGYFTYYGRFGLIGSIKRSENTSVDPDPQIQESHRYLQDFMGSIQLGAGIEYNLGGQLSLFGELGFRNNFTNAIDNQESPFSGHEKLYLNAIVLSIGAIF